MRINLKLTIGFALAVTACHKPAAEEDTAVTARVPVEVIRLSNGIIKDELTLFANTLYLKRNVVTAPIPAFITKVFIKLGEPVKEGQVLYRVETKERRA